MAGPLTASQAYGGNRGWTSTPTRRNPPNKLKIEGVMKAGKIPHNALIVVADGTGARFFRNSGHDTKLSLSADGELKPTSLLDDGPGGKRPQELSSQGDRRGHIRETTRTGALSPCSKQRLCGPCAYCGSTNTGPTSPHIAPGSSGSKLYPR